MARSYVASEEAIRQAIIAQTNFDLTEDTCGNVFDVVFANMYENEKTYACVLNVGGGSRATAEPFNAGTIGRRGKIWKWFVMGMLMIRYFGDTELIETQLRQAIDQIRELFSDDPRLGGAVDYIETISIDMPENADVNDIPFYFLFFTMEVWEKN